ncbi:uncharacterized protein Z518_01090 [Rhinocladiella mackenziei CBS 650.93]|uniref:Uncharacterized protein n=1 Tax=Rhinocladiella mackenziei CBS 650.93 TaxID=1442369 RepID=A0A0D2IVF5_9EURO|nr:uncharacterized protein Z518_01090 [Rhinocladiella mackenziei CBS 650.93]KIX10009.1 hypothetical protein Z518_01090 [Rhinocladiella mackenziei CBS 650.93]
MSSDTTTTTTSASSLSKILNSTPNRPHLDFSSLQALFPHSQATPEPSPLWYVLTTAVLLSFHKEKLIGELWTYLATNIENDESQDHHQEHLLPAARRIREACLKASTLVGFPRAINALTSLNSSISHTHPSLSMILSSDQSLRSSLSTSEKSARGMALFTQIYQQHTSRVLDAMDAASGGDLTHFAINCIYGELLSEDRVIGALETGLLEFACCLADGCGPQAKG